AIFREDVPDLADGAVSIVGHDVNNHRNAAGSVTFVLQFFDVSAFKLPGALHDRTLDIVGGHIHLFGIRDSLSQSRVAFGVSAPNTCRDGDFLDELGEHAPSLGINGAFFVFDTVPLRMAGHRYSFMRANFGLSLAEP